MKTILSLLGCLLLSGMTTTALADNGKVYKDGPVVEVTYIRTRPGRFDDYMQFLSTTYRSLMEANKKAGLIQDYAIYSAFPRSPQEPNLLLTITYPNMAAMDRTDEFEAVSAKSVGSMSVQIQAEMDREALREVLGSEMVRELVLK